MRCIGQQGKEFHWAAEHGQERARLGGAEWTACGRQAVQATGSKAASGSDMPAHITTVDLRGTAAHLDMLQQAVPAHQLHLNELPVLLSGGQQLIRTVTGT